MVRMNFLSKKIVSGLYSKIVYAKSKMQHGRRQSVHLLLVLSLICLVNSQVVVASTSVEPTLEKLLVSRVLFLCNNDPSLLSSSDVRFNKRFDDVFFALDTFDRLNLNATDLFTADQRSKIGYFILCSRSIEVYTEPETVNQTTTITTENDTQETIIEQVTIVHNYSRFENWWGSIHKSVRALRMLQLLKYDLTDILPDVKELIIHEFADKGFRWNVGQEGWDDTYAAIVEAYEYELFDILPSLGLAQITRTTLQMLESKDLVTDGPTRLMDINHSLTWSDPVVTNMNITATLEPPNLFSYQLPLQRLSHIIPGCYMGDYAPFTTLTLAWKTQNLVNLENETYGIDTYNFANISTNSYENVTLANGEVKQVLVESTSTEWALDSLHYTLEYQILNSHGVVVCTQHIPFTLADPQMQIEIPLHEINIDLLEDYYMTIQAYQDVHVEAEMKVDIVNDSYIDEWNDSLLNDSLNESEMIYLDEYQEEYRYEEDDLGREWEVSQEPIVLNASLSITTPELTYLTIQNDYQDASVYFEMNIEGFDGFEGFVWSRDEYKGEWSLNHEAARTGFQPVYVFPGENLLGIKDNTRFDLLLTPALPMDDTTEINETTDLPHEIHFWSYEATKNYNAHFQMTPYLGLFNQSLTDLPLMQQQMAMIGRITAPDVIPDLFNEYHLMSSLYWYYNNTSFLFEHDLYEPAEVTLDTWRVLDSLGITDKYLSKSHYDSLLELFMEKYYHETLNTKKQITSISIYNPEQTEEELKYINLFVKLLTYRNTTDTTGWTVGNPIRTPTEMSFKYVGSALQTTVNEDQMEELYTEAYANLYNRLADDEKLQHSILTTSKSTRTIAKSNYLSTEEMYWLTPPVTLKALDYLVSITMILAVLGLCYVSFTTNGKYLTLLAILAIFVVGFQTLVAPIISNFSVNLLSEYLRLSATLVDMLEEGIYNISAAFTAEFGLILQPKPTPTDYLLEETPNTIIDHPILTELTNIGNTTEELYQDYLTDCQQIDERWALRDMYSSDGTTQSFYLPEVPLTYDQFLQQVASTQISLALSQAISQVEQEQQEINDRRKQRELNLNTIIHSFRLFDDIYALPKVADYVFDSKILDTLVLNAAEMAAAAKGMKNVDETIDVLNKLNKGGGTNEVVVTRNLSDIISSTIAGTTSLFDASTLIRDTILVKALNFMQSRLIGNNIFSRTIYRIFANRFLGKSIFDSMVIPISKGNLKGAFIIDKTGVQLVISSIDDNLANIAKTIAISDNADIGSLRVAEYDFIESLFEYSKNSLDANDLAKLNRELARKNSDEFINVKANIVGKRRVVESNTVKIPVGGDDKKRAIGSLYDYSKADRQAISDLGGAINKLERNFLINSDTDVPLTELTFDGYEKLSVKYKVSDGTASVIIESPNDDLLKQFLLEKTEIWNPSDFDRKAGVNWYPEKIHTPLTKNKTQLYYENSFFIHTYQRVKSNQFPTKWKNNLTGGETLKSRLVTIEIDLDLFQDFKDYVTQRAIELIQENRRYHNDLLSRLQRGKTKYKESGDMFKYYQLEAREYFWNSLPNQFTNEAIEAYEVQKQLPLVHNKLSGEEGLVETAQICKNEGEALSSNAITEGIKNVKQKNEGFQSIWVTDSNGSKKVTEEVLHQNTIKEAKQKGLSLDDETSMGQEGAARALKDQLDATKENKSNNILVEMFGLSYDEAESCKILTEYGHYVEGWDAAETFAPDLVIVNQNNDLVAVIQLKGKTQTKGGISATNSPIQIAELKRYEAYHGVNTAFINIKVHESFISYDWLVFGNKLDGNKTNPLAKIKQRVNELGKQMLDGKGLDPIIPRNLRGKNVPHKIYDLAGTSNEPYDIRNYFDELNRLINESHAQFLCFPKESDSYIKVASEIDSLPYLKKLPAELKELVNRVGISDELTYKTFKRQYERIITEDYLNRMLDYLLGIDNSPLSMSPEIGFLWNSEGYTSQVELQLLTDITAMHIFGDSKYDEIIPLSSGYYAGNVGDASFTLLVETGSQESIEWYWPSSVEYINTVTFDEFKFSGEFEDGVRYEIGSAESNAYKTFPEKCLWIRGRPDDSYSGWDYQSAGAENFARISRPGIEMCTGYKDLNVYEYPIVNWSWHLDPYANHEKDGQNYVGLTDSDDDVGSNDAKTIDSDYAWTNFDWNQAQISFLLKNETGQSSWIHIVSTPDKTPSDPVGPSGYTQYVDAITFLKERAYDKDGVNGIESDEYFYYFESPLIPEEIDLLKLARNAGLAGTKICLQEIAIGTGPRRDDNNPSSIYDIDAKNDLYISGLTFSRSDEGIHGYSQGVTKAFYKQVSVDMTTNYDSWVDFLKTNKETYTQMALDLACGFIDSDNYSPENNAVNWYEKALQADLHHEFKYFYTTGVIVIRDNSDSDFYTDNGYYPVRGLYIKTKEWGQNGHTMDAPIYSLKDVKDQNQVLIYFDSVYENGWPSDLWTYAAFNIKAVLNSTGYDAKLADAEEILQFMQKDPIEGMVILLGAIPDVLWDWKHPFMSLDAMSQSDYQTAVEEYSVLERYLENGGIVLTTGQYAGGWQIAFHNYDTGETTITDYNNASLNPTGFNLGVDIGDILHDKSFAEDGYVPSTASWQTSSSSEYYYPYLGRYYSLGLRDIGGSTQVRKIADGGNYADQVWWVREDGQGVTFQESEYTGQFVNFHTANDNLSLGAITSENVDFWLEDIFEVILGINISSPTGMLNNSSSVVSKNRQYPVEEDTGTSNESYYWFDTFDNSNDDDSWTNLDQYTINGMKVGKMSSSSSVKTINMVSVADYPIISANIFDSHNPTALTNGDLSEYTAWTDVTGGESSDRLNDSLEIEHNNCHQFYYTVLQPVNSTSTTKQGGYISLNQGNGLTITPETFFHMAVNPYKITSYEIDPDKTMTSDDWGKYATASEWWMELEIDDGSGSNKKIRYFFTLETPVWYHGAIYQPEFGYLHDQYWEYDIDEWVTKYRTNNNYDGIRWINIGIDSDFTSIEIWDGTDRSETTISELRTSQWTEFDRNILADYNFLFNQAAESIVVKKITHTGHFIAGEAFVLVDDFIFFDVSSNRKDYSLKTILTDGQHDITLFFAASSNGEVNIEGELHTIGDIWQDPSGNYCYLTGSILPQSGADLYGTDGDSWVNLGGDVIATATNLTTVLPRLNVCSLFYKNQVEIRSSETDTYLDNIAISGGQFTNPGGSYYFNDTTLLALKVVVDDTVYNNHYVIRELGNDYKISDYDYLTFDFLAETAVGNIYVELYANDSATGYRAYLTPDSNDLPNSGYYIGGNVTSQKQWYSIGLSLLNFRDYEGESPPSTLQFDAIRFNFRNSGTYWLDNISLNGLKGTLIWDTYADVFYHPSFTNSTLSGDSNVDDFGWTSYAYLPNALEVSLAHPIFLSESPIMVDLQEQSQLVAIIRGNNDSTASLTLYAYSEDGTKLSGTGSSITIDFSDTTKLLGWETPIIQQIDLSSLSANARFLACPEITTSSDWVLDCLLPLAADDPLPDIQNKAENTVLDSLIAIAQPFYENFENSNLHNWTLAQGTGATFNVDNGVIAVDGGTSDDAVVIPDYQLLTDNFEITFKTRVTSDDFTGWVIGNGANNYRCSLDIDDEILPTVDVIEEGTSAGVLIQDVELTTDIALNEWVVFKIRRDSSRFQMWINGQQVMDVTNSSYNAPYDFGFSVWHTASADFADLSIEPIEGYNLLSRSSEIIRSEPIVELPIAFWDLTTQYLDPNDTDEDTYWIYDVGGSDIQHNSKTVIASFDEDEGCFEFDGVDDFISITDHDDLSFTNGSGTDKPFSVSAWIKLEVGGIYGGLLCKYTSSGNREWLVHTTTSNQIRMYLCGTSGLDYICADSSDTLTPGSWYHIVATYNGSESSNDIELYVNGVPQSESRASGGSYVGMSNTNQPLLIGRYYNEYFDGIIASVSLFDYVLSPEEVLTLYQPGLSLVEPSDSVTIDNPLNTEDWILSGSLNINNGTIGDLLTLTIGGEDLVITAEELQDLLSFDVATTGGGSTTEDFETGENYHNANGWTNLSAPSGTVFVQDGGRYSSVFYSGHHDGGSGSIWRIDQWDDGGTHTACTLSGWVYQYSNSWAASRIYPVYTNEDNYIMLDFYRDRARLDARINGTTYYSETSTVAYWNSKWWKFEITVDPSTNQVDGWVEYWNGSTSPTSLNTHYDLNSCSWTGTLQSGKCVLKSRVGSYGDYWYDDLTFGSDGTFDDSLETPLLYTDESSLKLSLLLTEDEGTTVKDFSIYENDGTLINSPNLTRSMGVQFDGTNERRISIPNSESLDITENLTLAAWVNVSGDHSDDRGTVITKAFAYYMQVMDDGRVAMYNYKGNGTSSSYFYSTSTLPDNVWAHIAVVTDATDTGKIQRIYINGVLDVERSLSELGIRSYDHAIEIGAENYGAGINRFFNGYIRNAQIWDRALSADEIHGLANTFNPHEGDYGSSVPFTIQPLNDDANRIAVTFGSETLYLTNAGSDNILDSITIDDPTTSGLEIPFLSIEDTSGFLVNSDGSACGVSVLQTGVDEYTSSLGAVSGELDDANDELGIEIDDIEHTSGKHMIISVDVNVSALKPANGTLYVKCIGGSTDTYSWAITDELEFNAAESLACGSWTTLQVNTYSSGTNTDKLQIYLKGATGDSSLTLGRINILEVTDPNDCDVDDLLPYGITSDLNSNGQSIYLEGGVFVLEDNQQDANNSDFSYIDIPMNEAPLTSHTRVSFDWYLGVEDPSDAQIVAGVNLSIGGYDFEAVGSSGTPSIGQQPDIDTGIAAAEAWLDDNPDENYVYWYYYYYVNNHLKTYRNSLAITLGDGDNKGDIESGDTFHPYINDWDNNSLADNYNRWFHCDISISEYCSNLPTNWEGDIRLFIDGNGSGKKFQLRIANLYIYEQKDPISITLGKRMGEVKNANHFIDDWIASPLYPLYDEEQRLPKTNIIVNPSFEDGYNETTLYPDDWIVGETWDAEIKRSNAEVRAYSGDYYMKLGYFDWIKSSTFDLGITKCDSVLVSFRYQIPESAESSWANLKIHLNGTNQYTPTGIVTEWTYWQGVFTLNDTDGFYLQITSDGDPYDTLFKAYIDDVRVEPAGWTGDEAALKNISNIRSIDPTKLSQLSLLDGWYEITNVGVADHYLHAPDDSAGVDGNFAAENGYEQFFYTQLLIDSTSGNFDDQWILKVEESTGNSDNIYVIWVNGILKFIGTPNTNGLITLSDVELITGLNDILIEQLVEDIDAFNHSAFRVRVERNWINFTLRTVRPHSTKARTPLIYHDPQYKTKWITRDGSESSLKLDMLFGEGSGSHALDKSFNDNNGEIIGASWNDYELDFDGSGDYVSISDSAELKANQGTVAAWVKPSAMDRVVFASGHSTSNYYYCMLMIHTTGMPRFYMYNNGSNYRIGYATGLTLAINEWHHLVWQSTGSEWKTYVNGQEYPITMSQGSNDGKWFNDYSTNNFAIGVLKRPSPYQYFNGTIRHLQVWDRVLSKEEIIDVMLEDQTESGIVNASAGLASDINAFFNWVQEFALIGNSTRLQYYMDSELNMHSFDLNYTYDSAYENKDTDWEPGDPYPSYSPYSGHYFCGEIQEVNYVFNMGHQGAMSFLMNNPAYSQCYWTIYHEYAPIEDLYIYKTTKTAGSNPNPMGKTIWHPFGSVLMTSDVFPSNVYGGEDRSKVEQYLESGGKVLFSGGYIPFAYYSTNPATLIAVSTSGEDYTGALGHQKILDFDGMNNDDGNFDCGMFVGMQQDDDYEEGMAIINESTSPGYPGSMSNLDFINYEPVSTSGLSPAWTQLPHTGYQSHMVLTRHEYDVKTTEDDDDYSYEIYNADGSTGTYSHNEYGNYNHPEYAGETMISPLDLSLWFKPYLADTYGGITYNPSGSNNGYYHEYGGGEYIGAHYSHHETSNVGTALVQAGSNAKGILGIMPMFEWKDLSGLNTHANDASSTEGKYSDRGYSSVTNSPSTERIARRFASIVTAQCIIEMLFDAIEINVCRDNSTSGNNFLNFTNINHLGGDWEVTGSGFGNLALSTNFADKGPLTVASYATNQNDYSYLVPQSGYPIYGGSYRNAIGNWSNTAWKNMMFNTESETSTSLPPAPPLSYIVKTPNSLITKVNIDKQETANASTNDKAKFLTINGLRVDTNNDVTLHTQVTTSYHGQPHRFGSFLDLTTDYASQPAWGYSFGTDSTGGLPTYERGNYYYTRNSWTTYDSSLTAFGADTLSFYSSTDSEMVLRNSEFLMDNEFMNATSADRIGYYQPLAFTSGVAQAGLTVTEAYPNDVERPGYQYIIVDADKLNDNDIVYGCWGPHGSDFDTSTGEFNASIEPNQNNRVKFVFSSQQEENINDIVIYAGIRGTYQDPLPPADDYDEYNHPHLIRITLYNSSGSAVYRTTEEFAPGNKFDFSLYQSYEDQWLPSPPLIHHLDKPISAKYIELEVWSLYTPIDSPAPTYRYVWLAEVDAYTGSNSLDVISYTDTEAITRVPDYYNYTNSNRIMSMDNGDDIESSKMFSKPRQASTGQVTISVTNVRTNPKMKRWNMHYSAPVGFSTGNASFRDAWDGTDLVQKFWNVFKAIIIIIAIVGAIIAAAVVLNAVGTYLIGTIAMTVLDVLAVGFFIVELFATGMFGGWEGCNFYNSSILFRTLYHFVFDWDGTIVRMVVLGDRFDFYKIRFKASND